MEHRNAKRKRHRSKRNITTDNNDSNQTHPQHQDHHHDAPPSFVVAEDYPFGPVPGDILEYIDRIDPLLDEQLKQPSNRFNPPEEHDNNDDAALDPALLVENVYSEVATHELALATDPRCSRTLEKLLRRSNDYQLRVFLSSIAEHIPVLFRHRFGSHVCQTLLGVCADVVDREVRGESKVEKEDGGEVDVPTISESIVSACKTLHGLWVSLIQNRYATHLVRSLLSLLSGESSTAPSQRKQANNAQPPTTLKRKVPSSFAEILDALAQELLDGAEGVAVRTWAVDPVTSPVLQILIGLTETRAKIVEMILGCGEDEVRSLVSDRVGAHLMEKMISVADAGTLQKLDKAVFRGHLATLSQDPCANFVVQRRIERAGSANELAAILEEVQPIIEALLFNRRSGVLVSLVQACRAHAQVQGRMLKAVLEAIGAAEEKEKTLQCAPMLLYLAKYETVIDEVQAKRAQLNGSLVLQGLVGFEQKHNKVIVESVLAQRPTVVFNWARDATSSRVLEGVLESKTVAEDRKKRLVKMFQEQFGEMSVDKYGSHVVDKCWDFADVETKVQMMEEFVKSERKMQQSVYGQAVQRRVGVERFKRKRSEWVVHEEGRDRKRSMFDDLVGNR
ncbi:armadillo-type protein [Cladochytrium replicatum]|nr:armadillo-type protein [Cladochytrium replicatum]